MLRKIINAVKSASSYIVNLVLQAYNWVMNWLKTIHMMLSAMWFVSMLWMAGQYPRVYGSFQGVLAYVEFMAKGIARTFKKTAALCFALSAVTSLGVTLIVSGGSGLAASFALFGLLTAMYSVLSLSTAMVSTSLVLTLNYFTMIKRAKDKFATASLHNIKSAA